MIKKIFLFVFLFVIAGSLFLYYKYTEEISTNTKNFLFIVNEDKKSDEDKILHLILFRYVPKSKELKVLFINDKITIIQKKIKSRTFNENYYLQKTNANLFIENEIKKIFTKDINIDNYIAVTVENFENFIKFLNKENLLGEDFRNNLLKNNDYLLQTVYNIKFINGMFKNIDKFLFFKFLKFIKNNSGIVETDIKNFNVLKLYLALNNIDNIYFMDVPVVNRRKRIELNKEFVEKTTELFFQETVDYSTENKLRVKVLNASKKQRMAIKVADKLRSNKFDVFEWGSYNKVYDYTVILDLVGSKEEVIKLKNVIDCGEILHRIEPKPFEDVTVILGKDCNVSDSLDRKN